MTGTMEEPERDLVVKQKILYYEMRSFNSAHVDENTLPIVYDKMKFFDDALRDYVKGIQILLLSLSDSLNTEKVEQWKTAQSTIEKDSEEYKKNIFEKANAVKKTLAPSFPSSGSMHAQSQVTTSMLQGEQLKEMRRQSDIMERTQQEKFNETLKESESKRAAAEAKAKNKVEAILADCEELAEKIGTRSLEAWKLQSDLEIGRGMKEIKTWESSLEKIVSLKRNLDDIVASGDLDKDEVEYLEVKVAVERTAQEVMRTIHPISLSYD